MKVKALTFFILIIALLCNCSVSNGTANDSESLTQRNVSETMVGRSFRKPVELCLTWWLVNKRFYKNCVIKDETDLLEGSASDLKNCVNDIKKNISPSVMPTVTVLKIDSKSECTYQSNMTAHICMFHHKDGTFQGYPWNMTIMTSQKHLVHIDSENTGQDLDFFETGIAPVTPLRTGSCENVFEILAFGRSIGASNFVPLTQANCIVQKQNGKVYGDYCLEYGEVENKLIQNAGNCSLSEYSLGIRHLFSKASCDKVKIKAFCIIETLPHEYHYDFVYTFCARPILPFEEDNITNWKIKVGKDCLAKNPIDLIVRVNNTEFKTIDINDEDIYSEINVCAIYSGDTPYTAGTNQYFYYSDKIMISSAITGIIVNVLALITAIQQTIVGSVKVYIIVLVLSNIILAVNFSVNALLIMTPLFSHLMCYISPIIYRTFTDISLLVMLSLSVERTIAVYKPLLIKSWCTAARARKVSYSSYFIYLRK